MYALARLGDFMKCVIKSWFSHGPSTLFSEREEASASRFPLAPVAPARAFFVAVLNPKFGADNHTPILSLSFDYSDFLWGKSRQLPF